MRRALGKGLAQLLGEQSDIQPNELELELIVPNPNQPRKHFDEDALAELADSIKEVGLLQPLVVRPIAENKYEIIAGERRYRASKLAGLDTVPVVVRSADSQVTLQLALIENVQREDINAVECALAYRQLQDDFSLTQEQIAQKVGKSRVAVANTLRLLRLPEEVLDGIASGLITEGHAKALLSCENERQVKELFFRIVDQGMTVREAEKAARSTAKPVPGKPAKEKSSSKRTTDPNEAELESALSTYFGLVTHIERGDVGGRLAIEFYSDDDLQRILEILGVHL